MTHLVPAPRRESRPASRAEPAGADAWRVRIVAASPPDGPAAVRRTRDTLIESRSSTPSAAKETNP